MTDVTIGALAPATALTAEDKIELEQGDAPGNSSAHATLAQLREYASRSPENVQAGSDYTLVRADAFKLVTMASGAANVLTVPPNSVVDFPVGTRIDLGQDGVGQTTVAAGAGVTIRTPGTLKLRKQWAKATLIKRAINTWDLEGNLEAAP